MPDPAPTQHTAPRRAIFGGTFDPPHRGHMAIARAAADAFHLDQVLFAPTGRQPLKLKSNPSRFADRLAMVAAACADANRADHDAEAQNPSLIEDRFAVTDLDAPRPNGLPNYTVDTLAALRALYPNDRLFSLAGADSFLNLHHWREPQRLLELTDWIVVSRPGYPLTEDHLAPLHLTAAQRARIHLLTSVEEDVSATGLRERLRQGDPCTDLLSPSVAAYIRQHALYLPA